MALALSSCSLLSDDDGTIPALPPTTIVVARPVDVATLRTLLPTAADIGPGFVEVSTTDDAWDAPAASPAEGGTAPNDGTAIVAGEGDDFGIRMDRALQESCPGAARFLLGGSYGDPTSSGGGSGVGTEREYEAPDGRAFSVSVSAPTSRAHLTWRPSTR